MNRGSTDCFDAVRTVEADAIDVLDATGIVTESNNHEHAFHLAF